MTLSSGDPAVHAVPETLYSLANGCRFSAVSGVYVTKTVAGKGLRENVPVHRQQTHGPEARFVLPFLKAYFTPRAIHPFQVHESLTFNSFTQPSIATSGLRMF